MKIGGGCLRSLRMHMSPRPAPNVSRLHAGGAGWQDIVVESVSHVKNALRRLPRGGDDMFEEPGRRLANSPVR